MADHLLHIYTGDGKGKTTAAMGLALRMLGHGGRVLVVQFMKDGSSGQVRMLAQLPGITVRTAPVLPCFTFLMNGDQLAQSAREHHAFALSLQPEDADLVILDELNCALSCGLLSEEIAKQLIQRMLTRAQTVITGRDAPQWLLDMGDYVSCIQAQKHPYDRGTQARQGIEW